MYKVGGEIVLPALDTADKWCIQEDSGEWILPALGTIEKVVDNYC